MCGTRGMWQHFYMAILVMMIDFDYFVMYKKYAQPKQAYKT